MAMVVMCDLARKPIVNPLGIKYRKKVYEKLYRALVDCESRIARCQIK